MTDYKLTQNSIVDELAQFIRSVDGDNKMGAGAMAEKICERFRVADPAVRGEPVGWQFYQDGKWWFGDDRIKDHRKNTEAAGYLVRDVYAAPQPAPRVPEGYAGATVWIGDKRVTQVVTEESLKYERETGMAITHAAQACLDLLAAAHRKGDDA